MDDSPHAFSFVDRITSIQPGRQACGRYRIPAGLSSFPPSLVAEAVGQLAAWAAMAAVEFTCRPVAGLAGAIHILNPVRPGPVLELTADLDRVDPEAVAYAGAARADGAEVLRLQDCVGPMVPLEDFDDPEAVRRRFARLCGPDGAPTAFAGLPPLAWESAPGEDGRSLRAALQVPQAAPLFADHFPRRPVFPGTLLMQVNLEVATACASACRPPPAGQRWSVRTVAGVKLRAFIAPGERLEFEARLENASADTASLTVETRRGGRAVGRARVALSTEARP